MSALDIKPSASFRSPTKIMPGALDSFDEEVKDNPQKLSDAQIPTDHQRQDTLYITQLIEAS
jgi:hypothetical protein